MWNSLHTHSQYSILDASASVSQIAKRAAAFGMEAVALTDHGNLFGAIDFYKACKEVKIKPIIGCELYVAPKSRLEKKKEEGLPYSFHLTLLAKNDTGYHNLCHLSSIGYLEGFYYNPRIDEESLAKHKDGLICLSGCLSSKLSHDILKGDPKKIHETISFYKEIFGEDYYFEIMRHPMSEMDLQADGILQESWLFHQYQDYINKQNKINEALISLSKEYHVPLVATNDSHYIDRKDWRAHEILLNIQSGEPCLIWEKDALGNPKYQIPNPKRRTYASHECYFKTPEQIAELFKDLPEAISNTKTISDKCNLTIDFNTKHYPIYIPPELHENYTKEEQAKSVEDYLWKLCREGLEKRYTPERLQKIAEVFPGKDPLNIVMERLEYEMSIIVPKGMADYLLIVWDFINWAKSSDIPVGPGRGSGAGSIVLYLIGITDIEPLRFHLFFERFINPERLSYPDIDVDICMDRRQEVIQYTLNKYGKDNVAQIITFGTMKAKMTIKDVGRVLNIPLAKVNEIAKLVPDDLDITLEKALEKDRDLRAFCETDEDAKKIIDIGKTLEGSIRSTGIHAAGIIISAEPLSHLIPLTVSKDASMPVTQYSMKPVEMVGMLKVDFLGLTTLTAIRICADAIKDTTGRMIDWVNLPLDDTPTFDLLNQGKTLGVFQLESSGMQELARQLHLDRFEEIIAVGALYRPGPMDMIPSFINRKHNREPIENDHPWMKDILAETYGIMVYQEQVMQIASKLANYSLGEGDVLRRAMGKKDSAQMAKEREKFRLGAKENMINEETSMLIFDKMEKFASYGFNKSHAAAYGFLSYVTAFFKANYPAEWMAALMTCVRDDLTKVSKFIRESQTMNINILPPDINEALDIFAATPKGIRFAMSGIKGIGSGVVEVIINERKKNGSYKSLYDFIKRLDTGKIGKKVIENLIDAGAFDFTNWSRDALKISVDPIHDVVVQEQKEKATGTLSLFSLLGDQNEDRFSKPPKEVKKSSKLDVLLKEKELLGFFLTGHPMDAYASILQKLSCVSLSEVEAMNHDAIFRSAFIVENVTVRHSAKTQKKFAILMISDGMESYELPIWSELFEEKGLLLKENQLLYAVLQVDTREGSPKLQCKWLDDLTQANEIMIKTCDEAFDRAKHIVQRQSQNYQKNGQKNEKAAKNTTEVNNKKQQSDKPITENNKKMTTEKLTVALNIESVRLSHILKLKEIFSAHPGNGAIEINFVSTSGTLATINIHERLYISICHELVESIKSLPFVNNVKIG